MRWKGDDGPESITLRYRCEDQMRQWESQINQMIRQSALRDKPWASQPHNGYGLDPAVDDTSKKEDWVDQFTFVEGPDVDDRSLSPEHDTISDVPTQASLETIHENSPYVKVKVHFNEDIFVLRMTTYDGLVERVEHRIRLCDSWQDDGPLLFEYEDKDGYVVPLASTEDVQMVLEDFQHGEQLTLYVT